MRRSRRSSGFHVVEAFTLVELLVVITIIGLLAALIVPAVQGALETARTNTCRNNLRQVGLAEIKYATDKGYFPGYLNPKLNSSATVFPSWQIMLLNNLDRQNAYRTWIDNAVGEAAYLEMYICPSDNTAIGQSGPFSSFAVNTGKPGNDDANEIFFGISHNLTTSTAKGRRVALDNIPDGADVTLLATENVDAFKYYDSAMPTDPEDILGFQWNTATSPLLPNKSTGKRTNFTGADAQYGRPSSNHSSVFNVVFAGGNAKTIDEAIDVTLWQYLMTPNGKKATPAQTDTTIMQKEF